MGRERIKRMKRRKEEIKRERGVSKEEIVDGGRRGGRQKRRQL